MRVVLERRLAGGQTIRAVLESADILGHSALTAVRDDAGINVALVNVLDVAETALSSVTLAPPEGKRRGSAGGVGGACGEDPERISHR